MPLPTRIQPSPWIATSSVEPVTWKEPAPMRLAIEPTVTPRPTCLEFEPPNPGLDAAPTPWIWVSESWNEARARLVADRVDVREVVRGDVEEDLVCLEPARGGEHGTHHRDIESFAVRPPQRGPACGGSCQGEHIGLAPLTNYSAPWSKELTRRPGELDTLGLGRGEFTKAFPAAAADRRGSRHRPPPARGSTPPCPTTTSLICARCSSIARSSARRSAPTRRS